MEAQKYIRERVQQMAVQNRPQYRAIVVPRKKEKSFDVLSTFLLWAILLVAAVMLIAMFVPFDSVQEWWTNLSSKVAGPVATASTTPIAAKPSEILDFMRKDEAQKFISTVNHRLDKMEKDAKIWQHRTWVNGVALNEISTLCEQMDIDHHNVVQRGFVKIGENWTLSPLPKHVQGLSDEEKKELTEGLK